MKQYNSKKGKTQHYSTLVQSPVTTIGQETRWAYSTMLPSPHGYFKPRRLMLGVRVTTGKVLTVVGFLTHGNVIWMNRQHTVI